MAAVDPLPLVPAMWMAANASSGWPRSASAARMRSSFRSQPPVTSRRWSHAMVSSYDVMASDRVPRRPGLPPRRPHCRPEAPDELADTVRRVICRHLFDDARERAADDDGIGEARNPGGLLGALHAEAHADGEVGRLAHGRDQVGELRRQGRAGAGHAEDRDEVE